MQVNALDHVNIITNDIDATAQFYVDMFEMERRDAPPPLTRQNAQWMFDAEGRAVIHINAPNTSRRFGRDLPAEPASTGAVHHVALHCTGHSELLERAAARGVEVHCNFVEAIGLRQIFLTDPNGVLFELNFFGD